MPIMLRAVCSPLRFVGRDGDMLHRVYPRKVQQRSIGCRVVLGQGAKRQARHRAFGKTSVCTQ
jgi:hypothetical protein